MPYPLPTNDRPPLIRYEDEKHLYWIDGTEVPSVSKLLGLTTPKDALAWWGMRVGLAAIVALMQRDVLSWPLLANQVYDEILSGEPDPSRGKWRGRGKYRKLKTELEYLVQEHKLTTNDVKDDAAERGTAVHAAIEEIGTHDRIPNIEEFAEAMRGYIRAACRWWMDQEPELHRQEVIVGSRKYAYAGRYDLDCSTENHGRCLTDFKTSKDVYSSHFEQLRLYELAENELQTYLPKDDRITYDHLLVVRLDKGGEYEIKTADHVSTDTAIQIAKLAHARIDDAEREKAAKKAEKETADA